MMFVPLWALVFFLGLMVVTGAVSVVSWCVSRSDAANTRMRAEAFHRDAKREQEWRREAVDAVDKLSARLDAITIIARDSTPDATVRAVLENLSADMPF